MKRVIILGLVICAFTLTACEKKYACEYPGGDVNSYSDKDFSDLQIEASKNTCEKAGGSWSEK